MQTDTIRCMGGRKRAFSGFVSVRTTSAKEVQTIPLIYPSSPEGDKHHCLLHRFFRQKDNKNIEKQTKELVGLTETNRPESAHRLWNYVLFNSCINVLFNSCINKNVRSHYGLMGMCVFCLCMSVHVCKSFILCSVSFMGCVNEHFGWVVCTSTLISHISVAFGRLKKEKKCCRLLCKRFRQRYTEILRTDWTEQIVHSAAYKQYKVTSLACSCRSLNILLAALLSCISRKPYGWCIFMSTFGIYHPCKRIHAPLAQYAVYTQNGTFRLV